MNSISQVLRDHYSQKFALHGASSEGVDWGSNEANVLLRYQKMLEVLRNSDPRPTLLDVGCGSGILSLAALRLGVHTAVGVDIDAQAVAVAQRNARLNELQQRVDFLEFEAHVGRQPRLCHHVLVIFRQINGRDDPLTLV